MTSDYDKFHQNRVNLVIHIVAVPVFVICIVASIWMLISGEILISLLLLLGPVLSLAVQGFGHKKETVPPEPFKSPGDFVRRIFTEQFFRFWVFVFSGSWSRALKASRAQRGA